MKRMNEKITKSERMNMKVDRHVDQKNMILWLRMEWTQIDISMEKIHAVPTLYKWDKKK